MYTLSNRDTRARCKTRVFFLFSITTKNINQTPHKNQQNIKEKKPKQEKQRVRVRAREKV